MLQTLIYNLMKRKYDKTFGAMSTSSVVVVVMTWTWFTHWPPPSDERLKKSDGPYTEDFTEQLADTPQDIWAPTMG